MWGIIATWRMALEGVSEASTLLENGESANDAIVKAVSEVENFEYYKSVGYGGLPNEEMEVELDAAFMDGDTFDVGAIGAIKDFANPVEIAYKLSKLPVNNFLVGEGAASWASKEGFTRKNMLTERAKIHYYNRLQEAQKELKPYIGHDTVGMVCLDQHGHMSAATSTSGLFMKKKGRVGDSPVVGSGLYVNSAFGGASATGLGEDLMKGCVSYEITRLMKEGHTPQEACEICVKNLDAQLIKRRGKAGDISVVALNDKGEWGCATNLSEFSFVVATAKQKPTVFLVKQNAGVHTFEEASKAWMDNYMETRTAPLKKVA